jgi:hypothetical protein
MPILIHCSSCDRQLRVPDAAFGKRVKCPSCGNIFVAQPPEPEDIPVAEIDDDPPPHPASRPIEDEHKPDIDDEEEYGEPRRPSRHQAAAAGAVMGPGISLMIVGGLGLLYGLANLYVVLTGGGPNFVPGQGVFGFGAAQPQFGQVPNPGAQAAQQMGFQIGLVLGMTVPVLWGLIVTLGGFQMLRLKARALAMTGAIFALVPCNPCCLAGLPFGIWALVVLNRDDVSRAFG